MVLTITAQTPTFDFISTANETQIAVDALEKANGNYVFTVAKTDTIFFGHHSVKFIELNNQGQYVKNNVITSDTFSLYINRIFPKNQGYDCIGIKRNIYTNAKYLWFITLDNNFNIIYEKATAVNFNLEEGSLLQARVDNDGNYIIIGSYVFPLAGAYTPFAIKIDALGNVLKSKSNYNFYDAISDFLIRRDSVGYLCVGFRYMALDTNFQIVYRKAVVPLSLDPEGSLMYLDDSTFIEVGKQVLDLSTLIFERSIGVRTMNHQLIILDEGRIGKENDTVDIPAFNKAIDFVTKDKIYCGGMSNIIPNQIYYPIGNNIMYLALAQFDSVMNKNWQRFYGGDAYYIPYGILATSDGGCLMYGYRYDYNMDRRGDFYVLKVDANGNAITSTAIPLENELITNIYPNPFVDYLKIETETYETLNFQLFNASGQIITQKLFYNTLEINDLNDLPIGLYFYTITKNNRILKSGKILKQ